MSLLLPLATEAYRCKHTECKATTMLRRLPCRRSDDRGRVPRRGVGRVIENKEAVAWAKQGLELVLGERHRISSLVL